MLKLATLIKPIHAAFSDIVHGELIHGKLSYPLKISLVLKPTRKASIDTIHDLDCPPSTQIA